ncbi:MULTISPECIES: ribosome maturation factor RimM [Corynebacterium]|uniref:Ribosome maturation factor RimM n=1 Tax=Corynebacterium meridianum TaxID=2765363 RepID=A0A934M737_9CORY|nr:MULTISPECIES: ribosome maturation factor RimM [Corynebacterium]MBI8989194.1 ribosome maturation factor RimM [Corynebacterium meridianum]MCL0120478.1 ribosome maturation factor RimM [Corynebacterium pygosceleis]
MENVELLVGRVVKSHGIRGEVSVEVTTDEPEARFVVGEVLTGRQGGREHRLTIDSVRGHQNRLLIKFAEIADRNAADSLRGTRFFGAPRESEPGEEGFYDHELEGLRIVQDGEEIGEVTGVLHGPAGETLEVRLDTGKDVLIPFVHAIVPDVDLGAGTATITPPEGLLDL